MNLVAVELINSSLALPVNFAASIANGWQNLGAGPWLCTSVAVVASIAGKDLEKLLLITTLQVLKKKL